MNKRILCVLAMAALLLMGCSTGATAIASPVSRQATTAMITREEAQAIALEHAGLTADQVQGLRAEYEFDDGIARYEVRFRQGRWEYDYEINAATGDIISYDRDILDFGG